MLSQCCWWVWCRRQQKKDSFAGGINVTGLLFWGEWLRCPVKWVRAESRRQFYEASGPCMRCEMSDNVKAILAGRGSALLSLLEPSSLSSEPFGHQLDNGGKRNWFFFWTLMPGELVRRALNVMAQDSPDGAWGCDFQMESLIYLLVLEDVFAFLNCIFGLGTWNIVGIISFPINYNSFLVSTHIFLCIFLQFACLLELTYLGFLTHRCVSTEYSDNLSWNFPEFTGRNLWTVCAEVKSLSSVSPVRTSAGGTNPARRLIA